MHLQIHENRQIKTCHYFNNENFCPFAELGCKFLHIIATKCKYDELCSKSMCAFQHSKIVYSTMTNDVNLEVLDGKSESVFTETEETGDELNFTVNDIEDRDVTLNFHTSTPTKMIDSERCEECENASQCADCIVKYMTKGHISSEDISPLLARRHVHFSHV